MISEFSKFESLQESNNKFISIYESSSIESAKTQFNEILENITIDSLKNSFIEELKASSNRLQYRVDIIENSNIVNACLNVAKGTNTNWNNILNNLIMGCAFIVAIVISVRQIKKGDLKNKFYDKISSLKNDEKLNLKKVIKEGIVVKLKKPVQVGTFPLAKEGTKGTITVEEASIRQKNGLMRIDKNYIFNPKGGTPFTLFVEQGPLKTNKVGWLKSNIINLKTNISDKTKKTMDMIRRNKLLVGSIGATATLGTAKYIIFEDIENIIDGFIKIAYSIPSVGFDAYTTARELSIMKENLSKKGEGNFINFFSSELKETSEFKTFKNKAEKNEFGIDEINESINILSGIIFIILKKGVTDSIDKVVEKEVSESDF
jgi:hypothetical protein